MTATLSCRLVDVAGQQTYALDGAVEFVVGRGADAHAFVADTHCSRRQFCISRREDGFILTGLSAHVATHCDGRPVVEPVVLHDGMRITAGSCAFIFHQETAIEPGARPKPLDVEGQRLPWSGDAAVPRVLREMTLIGAAENSPVPDGPSIECTLTDQEDVDIGRDPQCPLPLPHIQVSWRHARIRRMGSTAFVEDLGSANGTFVDGRRILLPQILRPGNRIGIGPYTLFFTGSGLTSTTRTDNLQLEGRELTCHVRDRKAEDGRKVILDGVSVVIPPHRFVCILGPTGSGKSTLLAALSARRPAAQGQVLMNQLDLYDNFDALKRDMAVVPQHDILHDALPLESALQFTAKLRLPRDTSEAERSAQVDALLDQTGLAPHRATKLGELSGGQRRRASLANELLSNPNLLFLDEVTSGLDERNDRALMQLFRRLADQGKTVICVTHTLANIEENCHLVILLTVGGKLAYFGPPADACRHFGVARFADIYQQLEAEDSAKPLGQRFRASPVYEQYIASRLSTGSVALPQSSVVRDGSPWRNLLATVVHQLPLLLKRYARVFVADRRSLWGMVAQVAVVAIVLHLVFGNLARYNVPSPREQMAWAMHSNHVLFVLGIACFWFGCNNSVKEIVRERAIYTKELQVNLDPVSYYASKFLLQFCVSSLQAVILLIASVQLCALPGDHTSQAAIILISAAAGVALGLFLSAATITEAVALTLVPLVLIPQIILSDVFVKLNGVSEWLAGLFVANQWVFGMLRGTLPQNLVFISQQAGIPARSLSLGLCATTCQIILLMTAAIAVLHVRDRLLAGSNRPFLQTLRPICERIRQIATRRS